MAKTFSEGQSYGLDADLKAKQDAAYDPALEKQVTDWIGQIVGDHIGDRKPEAWLHDGLVLCKLANTIKPGSIKKPNTSTMVFKQRENITFFQKFAREVGVPEASMFGTDDLFDAKNMNSVIKCIFTLGGVLQVTTPEFSGPKLGNPINADSKDSKRASGLATQSGGFAKTMEVQKATTGARQVAGGFNAAVKAPGEGGADAAGLDRDLQAKKEAKRDPALEKQACQWIEAVTGQQKGDQGACEWLKSGKILCELANKIKPGVVKSINDMNTPFKQRENITFFQKAARDLGVPESSLFGTDDLYEEKDMGTFVASIIAFGGAIQVSVPEYNGPKLGTAVTHYMEDQKREGLMATSQTEAMQRAMEVERPRDNVGIMAKAV
jgi:hypothetical protein